MQPRVVLLSLFAACTAIVGVQAQPSTQDEVVPDTRVRGYWVDPLTGLMWAGRDNFGRDRSWRQAVNSAGIFSWPATPTGGCQRLASWSFSTIGSPNLPGSQGSTTSTGKPFR